MLNNDIYSLLFTLFNVLYVLFVKRYVPFALNTTTIIRRSK